MKNFFLPCLLMAWSVFAANTPDTLHLDHRAGLSKLMHVNEAKAVDLSGEARALDFLERNHHKFGLNASVDNLVLDNVRHSLLGTHYTFKQVLGGYDVLGANLVVSISNDNGSVYRVYNNTFPVGAQKALDAQVNVESADALDIAWNHLRVHGKLLEMPKATLAFIPEGSGFRLVYRTEVSTEAPFGYWGHTIDAKSGVIIEAYSRAISRDTVDVSFDDYQGPVWDRKATTSSFERARDIEMDGNKMLAVANGTGQVFDPDPVTTLANDTLEDNSAASNFTAAYFTRDLLDIDLNGGTYSLTGPWVTIANFESPNTAPTTTNDGNWTGVRGQQEFNDAMTYFHLDQNQRYIQSLGFAGGNGIQYGSIEADADGLSGADNSHYIPSSNRVAFGKGCVDDNEDAFVILHEYGHAINFSINSNWNGGDTGGMGEGFGDYWGGSYRYSTTNGPSFHPEWAFPWDGHNNCWGGRVMNNTSGQYDPSKSYGAHTSVNGVLSDELWSSPLFQSLVRLTTNHGVPRAEVDQIILEAHFGISSGPSMRDMATAIVATAEALQPSGPHAGVLREEFEARNILAAGPNGSQTDTFNATVAANNVNSHSITVSGGNISLTLSWGSGNLDMRLYDGNNNLVASATSKKDNPETILYATGGNAGTYRIDVLNTSRKHGTSYTLTANYNP